MMLTVCESQVFRGNKQSEGSHLEVQCQGKSGVTNHRSSQGLCEALTATRSQQEVERDTIVNRNKRLQVMKPQSAHFPVLSHQ